MYVLQTQGPKQQIIDVLSAEFPLTAKKVYNALKRRYQIGSTYVAVYQHMRELVDQGVVMKEGLEYRLDGKWIERTRQFAINTENNYSALLNGSEIAKIDDAKVLVFDSFEQYFHFAEAIRERYVKSTNGSGTICWLGTHAGGPIFFMKDRLKSIRNTIEKNIKYYIAIRGDAQLDRTMANFYRSMGVNSITGANDKDIHTIGIYGDTLLFLIFSEDLRQAINNVFENANGLSDVNIGPAFEEILGKERKLFAIMTSNKDLAEKYRNSIIKLFDHK